MNVAFSTAGYPHWDVTAVIEKAAAYGFDAVELRSLPAQLHMPLAEELNRQSAALVAAAEAKRVRILCLATHAVFSERDGRLLDANKAHVIEQIVLASRLGCPYVRVLAGTLPDLPIRLLGKERRDSTIVRIARALHGLGMQAAAKGVTLLVQNSGDFCESADLWQIVEAADSPGVRCAWNSMAARSVGEMATTAIPRLASRLKLVHIADGRFDGQHRLIERTALGEGELDVYGTIQLLRGIAYRGTIVFDHPTVWAAEPTADAQLDAAAKTLRAMLDEKPVPLTAYKGDKFPPRQGYDLAGTT